MEISLAKEFQKRKSIQQDGSPFVVRYTWILAISCSENNGTNLSTFVGTLEEAERYMLSAICDDRKENPNGYDNGSELEEDLELYPTDESYVISGYATYMSYHIDYTMTRLDHISPLVPDVMLTDKKIEQIWDDMTDVPFDEDEDGSLVLAEPYYIWDTGTDREEIWHWFDHFHSKGVAYLLYERDMYVENEEGGKA